MLQIRKAADRGHARHGWLDSFHSFSFADYHDPAQMGVGNLRVLNDDRIAPGTGFGMHAHRDMEIISVVLEGALAHRDDMAAARASEPVAAAGGHRTPGHTGVIVPGDVQRMSAGTGVRHSEFNAAESQTTHFLQIWLLPDQLGVAPAYDQRHFDAATRRGRLALLVSPDGREGSLTVNADASLRAGLFDSGEHAVLALDSRRLAYVFVARGSVQVNGTPLQTGDAVTLADEATLRLDHADAAEVLVFDLAPP